MRATPSPEVILTMFALVGIGLLGNISLSNNALIIEDFPAEKRPAKLITNSFLSSFSYKSTILLAFFISPLSSISLLYATKWLRVSGCFAVNNVKVYNPLFVLQLYILLYAI